MAIEKASYKLILKEGPYEIRLYEPMVLASSRETDIRGGMGFNNVFNYISGGNKESLKISMTSPVLNDLARDRMTTSFVMPGKYRLEDLPQPVEPGLQLREIQGRHVAANVFKGSVNDKIILRKTEELSEWLREKGIPRMDTPELARYQPPFLPGFMKRNEILFEVHVPGGFPD